MTGSGTLADPFVIWNVNDLQNMNLDRTAYYELGQDIDASVTVGWNGGLGFDPIGQAGSSFTGSLDGKGHTISNLYINRPANNRIGLFGFTEGATIKNVTLANAHITAKSRVGALVGQFDTLGMMVRGWVTNCHSSGAITGGTPSSIGGLLGECVGIIQDCSSSCAVTALHAWQVGGLIGWVYYWDASAICQIERCSASGNVTGEDYVGGLIGASQQAVMNECHASGEVVGEDNVGGLIGTFPSGIVGPSSLSQSYASGKVSGKSNVGGFVGSLGGTVEQCYAIGDVTASSDDAGGFAGQIWNNLPNIIQDCYASGDISGTTYVGGFVGWLVGEVKNCYSTGKPTGTSRIGGFSGVTAVAYTPQACFWDIKTSGTVISDHGVGLTTEQMNHQANFTGWDFTSIWNISRVTTGLSTNITPGSAMLGGLLDLTIINEAYPFLRWQTVVELPCDCGFEWGETAAFGNFTPVDSKNTGESFAKALYGLEPQRTYYFRARAHASPGPIHGGTKSFTTLHAIEVETLPATNITENSARIWGRVRKVPVTAMARFDWGGTINYGAETPWAPGLVSDDMFYFDLRNLAEGRAYHFRAVAMGSSLVYGNDMTFTTRSPVGPVVLIQEELAHLMEVS